MIEAEKCFVDSIADLTASIEDLMKTVTRDVLNRCDGDIVNASPDRRRGDYAWLDKPFPTLSYADAMDVLVRNRDKIKSQVNVTEGINKEQELFLVKHVGTPVFVVDWPKSLKPFYMRENHQNANNVSMRLSPAILLSSATIGSKKNSFPPTIAGRCVGLSDTCRR